MKIKTTVFLALGFAIALGVSAKGGSHSGGGGSHGSHSHTGSNGSSHSIKGYTKKDGTYVAPSHATNPDSTKSNNWTHKGKVNPYTGKEGTKE